MKRPLPRWLHLFVTLVISLTLGGCAGPQIRDTKITSPNDGAVVARLLQNGTVGMNIVPNWELLRLARQPNAGETKETEFLVYAKMGATSRTSVFASTLPPGQYRLVLFGYTRHGAATCRWA